MNFQFYLEKLHHSDVFKEFMKENSDAYLSSGFFVIDKEGKDNKQHFDYYAPLSKNMVSFSVGSEIEKIPVKMFDDKVPEEVSDKHDFALNDVEKIVVDEIEKQKIKAKVQKIIFSLQRLDGKDFLVGTIFVSGLGMLRIHIDLSEMKITFFEKKSFFDMMKVIKKDTPTGTSKPEDVSEGKDEKKDEK